MIEFEKLTPHLIAVLIAVATSGVAIENTPPLPKTNPFDWIEMDAVLTFEMVSNLDGGLEQKTGFLGNFDLTFDIDPEKAGGWKNGRFFAYVLGNFGDNPTEYVGDIQGGSNIEAYDTLKIYEIWYEHAFFNESVFLLGGLHDYNSEFDVLEYGGLFFNSSFGISPDIAQVGPSIFPTTSLAVRGRVALENGCYALAAAYDGVPGDPSDPRGTQIKLDGDDGVFYGMEGGITHGEPATKEYYKLGFGGWCQTTDFEDFSGVERDGNGGVYGIAEASLTERLGLFLQLGAARSDRNQIGSYIGAGFNWNGLFLENDVFGLAAAHARNSDEYMDANQPADRAETALELTYLLALSENWSIQPDLQYIINPSMDRDVDDALVFALRVVAAY